jgi:hypothetical protein
VDDTNVFSEALTPAEKPVMAFCGEQELNEILFGQPVKAITGLW